MFKKNVNRAVLRLRIETMSPLLIRTGDSGLDPAASDLACVRTGHGRHGRSVYVPGSSLKGVIRSTAEAILRGEKWSGIEGACDPLDNRNSCGDRIRKSDKAKKISTAETHKAHCLACRLFGSTMIKGRCSVRDLFPWPMGQRDLSPEHKDNLDKANRVEIRHGVAIDRIMGSVKHGPFDSEMVPAGVSFWGDIALENYQGWQLGLLATAMSDFNDGFAQLGSTKSRGLGLVRIEVSEIIHEQSGAKGETPLDAAQLMADDERTRYGLLPAAALPAAEGRPRGLNRRFHLSGVQAQDWLEAGIACLEGLQ